MTNKFFSEIKGSLGFGCMRLPMKGEDVDLESFKTMTDKYMEAGYNYFDTAHGYISQKSEPAIRECVVKRYDREKFVLTNKLSDGFFNTREDILPLFKSQLELCGTDYFDFYLMHAQSSKNFPKYKSCHAYEIALELKEQGLIHHLGISFHDSAKVLENILTQYPQIEVVQLQFNYLDFDSPRTQSRKCYEVCRKYAKPVIIMEPVKGGALASLPENAQSVFDKLGQNCSAASYAMRFAAGFDGVMTVLSGMSNPEQMMDNIATMSDFKPLTEAETEAVYHVSRILSNMDTIPCTACKYCVDGCPKSIPIPDLFSCFNAKKQFRDLESEKRYKSLTVHGGRAADCIKCGKCEQSCPQNLEIRSFLEQVSARFD